MLNQAEEFNESLLISPLPPRKKRIAVIIPSEYQDESLKTAKMVSQALWKGSCEFKEEAEIIIGYLENSATYSPNEFSDLPPSIRYRSFQWRRLNQNAALRAMAYAGYKDWVPQSENYIVPDDGIQQFFDCDAMVFINDHLSMPLLPIRPFVMMVQGYLQRYVSLMNEADTLLHIQAAHLARKVMVTSSFAEQDVLQLAGLNPVNVCRVPQLMPKLDKRKIYSLRENRDHYFVWPTNLAIYKNHLAAIKALRFYYEELDGNLDIYVVGISEKNLLENELPHLAELKTIVNESARLKMHLRFFDALTENSFQKKLSGARFLWHPSVIENGNFTVIEASHLGVPTLSSDYPAIRELNLKYGLHLVWMNPEDSMQMALQLKWMQDNAIQRAALLPNEIDLSEQSVDHVAKDYWEVIRSCL